MKFSTTPIAGLLVIEPTVHGDARGWFMESFRQDHFNDAVGEPVAFVQDNHSHSRRGVLRGLHYQLPPHAQGKLVRCTSGAVWDVAVDIRRQSPTFGQWHGLELSADNKRQFWIPPGFAHGFVVLSDTADFVYKTTALYAPAQDRGLLWSDPGLGVAWPLNGLTPEVSAKDAAATTLSQRQASAPQDLFA